MEKKAVKFLADLSESFGPVGFERETARLVKRYASPFSDSVTTDKLGSVIFRRTGKAKAPRVLLAAHMDEVGFMVTSVDDSGFLRFVTLGGWFEQVLLGQRVKVRIKDGKTIPGVIASRPPHLMSPEKRKDVVKVEQMFIDVGCSNKEEAESLGIRIGVPVIPDSAFSTLQKDVYEDGKKKGKDTLVIGKGFDDRIGVVVACEVMRMLKTKKVGHPNTVVVAATTQEEVGLRGARTVANVVQPDVAIVLEVDISGDVPGIEKHEAPSRMGKGPSVLAYDKSMIPNEGLLDLVIETADKEKIPYQLAAVQVGGTDGGQIHLSNGGCPTVVVGVPTRHIHSHVGLASLTDMARCVNLVVEIVRRLDAKTVASFTKL